ncbi:MAG TPA: protein kinase, partial [Terriglobales bacterium]
LKVIDVPADAAGARAARERFLREARAAAALRHPNVAGVFHFGAPSEFDRCFYAMELVEGETLEALVRREGPLKVKLALGIATQVTRALVAAAAHGLVHRDLKPANIMLTPNDAGAEQFEAKVIDFGLAKSTAETAGERDLTHGGFVGTPTFASPEQLGSAPVDARSDIYSLGVTLWYALTGELPCPGRTIDEIRTCQAKIALPVEQLVARKIPSPVIKLLRRALATNPAERPQSARALLAELELCRTAIEVAPRRRRRWQIAALTFGILALGAAGLTSYLLHRPNPATLLLPEKSIAVLPFENLSKDKENAYFASGVQDEILSDLSRVADLKVISRTSVMQYQGGTPRNVREIGKALGVATVVEGSVQRIGNRVRVVAQLIDARSDTHLWGETYDRDLSDVFAIQGEIAQQIARQLQAKISPEEKAVIADKPTSDLTAYAFYSQAMNQKADTEKGYQAKVTLLQEAIRRDPDFILAYCLLGKTYTSRYIAENYDSEASRGATAAQARQVIDTALRLRPDRGEPHLTLAYYFFMLYQFSESRHELEIALRLLPNDAEATFLAARLDRHENRWDDALVKARRALELDPHNEFFALWTSETYLNMRRYQDDEKFIREAEVRNPAARVRFDACLARLKLAEGDLASARSLSTNPTSDWALDAQFGAAFCARDYDAALRIIAAAPPKLVAKDSGLESPDSDAEAHVYRAQGNYQKAEHAFLALRQSMDSNTTPQLRNEWYYELSGEFDAGLGRKEEAIREARHAVDMRPVASDPINGVPMVRCLAEVYAWTGERDRAIEQLEILAQIPSDLSYGELRFSPDWDSLRGDPRFEKLIAALKPKSVP